MESGRSLGRRFGFMVHELPRGGLLEPASSSGLRARPGEGRGNWPGLIEGVANEPFQSMAPDWGGYHSLRTAMCEKARGYTSDRQASAPGAGALFRPRQLRGSLSGWAGGAILPPHPVPIARAASAEPRLRQQGSPPSARRPRASRPRQAVGATPQHQPV